MFWNKKEKEVTPEPDVSVPELLLVNPLNGDTKTVKDDNTYLVLSLSDMEQYINTGLLPSLFDTFDIEDEVIPLSYGGDFSAICRYLYFLKGVDREWNEGNPIGYRLWVNQVIAWIDGTIRELYPLLLEKENNHKT